MSKVTFNVDEMLAEASAKTGLKDFGDERFRLGLEVLAETLDTHLSEGEVRSKERRLMVGWLRTRLLIQDAFRKYPEIHEQKIVEPMIVTGLPRSGTSALFNLLNSDPEARALLLWETRFPFPNEQPLQAGELDPRYLRMKEVMEASRDANFDKIHFAHPDSPEECILLQVYSFDGPLRGWEMLLEPYNSWFKEHSLDYLYQEQLNHMKLLQWQRPGSRWLIKTPAHMWDLPALTQHFPDARFVWGHRDPVGVTASMCSMSEQVTKMYMEEQDRPDLHNLGHTVLEWYAESLQRGLRDRQALSSDRIVDYGFQEFVDNPRLVVDRIYQHFNLPMGEATKQALSDHIEKNQKGKHGQHKYDLARYGLDEEQVRKRYDFYLPHPLV